MNLKHTFEITGKITINPKTSRKFLYNPDRWAMLKFHRRYNDILYYYKHMIESRYLIRLLKPENDLHVTFISGEDVKNELWSTLEEGKKIDVTIEEGIKTNGKYWWLSVSSTSLVQIRKNLGLPGTPYFPFHITIGTTHPYWKNQKKYLSHINNKNRCKRWLIT